MSDSIFTKIIKGEVPCHKIHEDDKTLAFLDIHPIQPGHTLVVPKEQIEFLWDLSDENYQALMMACKKVARRLRDVLGVANVGVKVFGLDVPHAHVHLIPFTTAAEFRAPQNMAVKPDNDSLAKIAKKLAF